MAGEKMFIIWATGSLACWKAMMALEEKAFGGISNKLVSFAKNQHRTEELLAINPRGELPTFKDGDAVVNESHGIIEYLESAYPEHGIRLLPEDNTEKAKVYQVLHEVSNLHQALVENIIHYKMHTPKDKLDQELLKERYQGIRKELDFWEKRLKTEGPFIAGNSFTMADCVFFPYIAFGNRLGLKLSEWPSVEAYYNHILPRPSVKATWPPFWHDKEGDKSVFGEV